MVVDMLSASLAEIRHQIKNSLSHIAGYSELLREDLAEFGWSEFLNQMRTVDEQMKILTAAVDRDLREIPDEAELPALRRELSRPLYSILAAAAEIRGFIDSAQVDDILPDVHGIIFAASRILGLLSGDAGENYRPVSMQRERSVESDLAGAKGTLLLIDDDEIFRSIFGRLMRADGFRVVEARDLRSGGEQLEESGPDALILDLCLGDEDGFELLELLDRQGVSQDIPVLVISGADDPESINRSLQAGATDFLNKDMAPAVWRVRIEAALERKRLQRAERDYLKAILGYQQRLKEELQEAAEYVESLLPAPIPVGRPQVQWLFRPSERLGGDFFGYDWLDRESFAVFIIDVSGHGIGSALHAAAVGHMLRVEASEGRLRDPAEILSRMNRRLPMEDHNELYFSLFFGIFSPGTGRVRYACGGGVPPYLIAPDGTVRSLELSGPVIGMNPEARFETREEVLPQGSTLYLYSDGLYEQVGANGEPFGRDALHRLMARELASEELSRIPQAVLDASRDSDFADDITLLRLRF